MFSILSIEEAKYLYDNYYSKGYSTVKLAKLFGHNHHYYLDTFKKYGYEIRSNKINSRKYTANFNYFKTIDSPEKAYWLGFIYADGYISNSQDRKKFGFSLSRKDREQIEKLNECLDSTYPIHDYVSQSGYKNNTEYSRIIIENETIFDDLVKCGVLEHKTDIIEPPEIDSDYIAAFILGYFDGDGSIYFMNTKYPFYVVSIVGTDSLLKYIHNYLTYKHLVQKPLKLEKRKKNQIVSYIRYGGNKNVETILDDLYSSVPNNLPLDRKRKLYLNCKNRIFSRL